MNVGLDNREMARQGYQTLQAQSAPDRARDKNGTKVLQAPYSSSPCAVCCCDLDLAQIGHVANLLVG